MATTIPAGFLSLPLPIAQLSLAAVLQCGQSFRWSICPLLPAGSTGVDPAAPAHEYRLCLRDRVVCLRQSSDTLFYRSVFPPPSLARSAADFRDAETLAWLRDYFQLEIDLAEMYEQWGARDPIFHNFKERFGGIRMLRQDPFENLVSFICSSNNNISRITKMVKALCQHYSPALVTLPAPNLFVETGDCPIAQEQMVVEPYHPFPPPSVLAAPGVSATLRSLGFGYRADFIHKTAKMLVETHGATRSEGDMLEPAEKWLFTLRHMSTPDAREELLKFMGVGRKVADCVLLMSLDKREVIPVDTHVYQIAVKHYGLRGSSKTQNMTPKLYEEVSSKLAAVWGEYAGWAHSVLFTSDLKSFSSYGLPTPSSSPSVKSEQTPNGKGRALPMTPSPTPSKRKRTTTAQTQTRVKKATVVVKEDDESLPRTAGSDEGASLAERVKRRRRVEED
ncbi:DNA glycosylase [Amylocystis lapponica]|nr:DNA glycosylase [Amylocystis lapponica]